MYFCVKGTFDNCIMLVIFYKMCGNRPWYAYILHRLGKPTCMHYYTGSDRPICCVYVYIVVGRPIRMF